MEEMEKKNSNYAEFDDGITFSEILGIIWKNVVMIVLIMIVSIGCGLGLAVTSQPTYSASKKVIVSSCVYDDTVEGTDDKNSVGIYNNYVVTRNIMQDIVTVCAEWGILEDKANEIYKTSNVGEISLRSVSVSAEEDRTVMTITYTDADPKIAAAKLDAYIDACQTLLNDKNTTPLKGDGADVTEITKVANVRINSNKVQTVLISAFVGVLIAAVAVILKYVLDDTITTKEDLERISGLKLFATVDLVEVEDVTKAKETQNAKK